MKKKSNRALERELPRPVFYRLALYRSYVEGVCRAGEAWVSSQRLAEAHGQSASTVRQDLGYLDCTGVARKGYDAGRLLDVLDDMLAFAGEARVVIVGCGKLGCALAEHGGLAEGWVKVCGLFDKNESLVGRRVGALEIHPLAALNDVVRTEEVEAGILTVPGAGAQQAAHALVAAGVRGILNLSGARIETPANVPVQDVRIVVALQELLYRLRRRSSFPAPAMAGARHAVGEQTSNAALEAARKEKNMARILIVDDDPDLVEASRTVLESEGYECASAGNREEGMARVDSFAPDLILLDVMMDQPDDGIAMAQDLRRKGVTTPIVLLTGISRLSGMDFGEDEEMVPVDAYIEKPVDPSVLLSKVKELLATRA